MKFKATVFIRLRASVSDAAGNAVIGGCNRLSNVLDISSLRLGKVIDIEFQAPDRETAVKEMYTLSDMLFANTVIEDWSYDLEEVHI